MLQIENAVVKKVGRDYDREIIECAMDLLDAQAVETKRQARKDFWEGFAQTNLMYSVAREVRGNERY